MNKRIFYIVYILFAGKCYAQDIPKLYLDNIKKADSCISTQDLRQAIIFYNKAIESNNGLAKVIDRYNMAVCFANLLEYDSAFYHLEKIVNAGKFTQFDFLEDNPAFNKMKHYERWSMLIQRIKKNSKFKFPTL